jgi:hypothetical protein
MIRPRPPRPRRGYTLAVVLVTLILLFGLWSYVSPTTSGLLRTETTRALRQTRDQAAMNVLAQALQLLQYSQPTDTANPGNTVSTFVYYLKIGIPNKSPIPAGMTGSDCTSVFYQVTYTCKSRPDPPIWQVQVSPIPQESFDSSKLLPGSLPPAWPPGAGQ